MPGENNRTMIPVPKNSQYSRRNNTASPPISESKIAKTQKNRLRLIMQKRSFSDKDGDDDEDDEDDLEIAVVEDIVEIDDDFERKERRISTDASRNNKMTITPYRPKVTNNFFFCGIYCSWD